jgi:hypothetical protein
MIIKVNVAVGSQNARLPCPLLGCSQYKTNTLAVSKTSPRARFNLPPARARRLKIAMVVSVKLETLIDPCGRCVGGKNRQPDQDQK